MSGPAEFTVANLRVSVFNTDSGLFQIEEPVPGYTSIAIFFDENTFLTGININWIDDSVYGFSVPNSGFSAHLRNLRIRGFVQITLLKTLKTAIRDLFGDAALYFSKVETSFILLAVVMRLETGAVAVTFLYEGMDFDQGEAFAETERSVRFVVKEQKPG